jgi:rSAM-associated Gly-rich repeat protein
MPMVGRRAGMTGVGKACEVGWMSLREKYRKVLMGMLPVGAVGVPLLLGAAASAAADQRPSGQEPPALDQSRVAERLAAIRDAVSTVAGSTALQAEDRLAWWAWRNGGGGWRNGGAWGNGGWRNGWHNGGWRNFWRNW